LTRETSGIPLLLLQAARKIMNTEKIITFFIVLVNVKEVENVVCEDIRKAS
jgi:hypothetical protein